MKRCLKISMNFTAGGEIHSHMVQFTTLLFISLLFSKEIFELYNINKPQLYNINKPQCYLKFTLKIQLFQSFLSCAHLIHCGWVKSCFMSTTIIVVSTDRRDMFQLNVLSLM